MSVPRVMTNGQVRESLDMRSLIAAMERAFRAPGTEYNAPRRWNLACDGNGALVMPCQSSRFTAVKVSTWRHEPGRGPRVVHAHYSMFELATGRPVLLCEADVLTEMRTAAVSAMATDKLARHDARVLGIFGTGRLAHEHLRALLCVRPFERVLVCGSTLKKSQEFAESVTTARLDARAVAADECASHSDVICTCTTASTPLFEGKMLREGTHLNAVGTFHAADRELDSETIRRSLLVVDRRESALAEAGEVVLPMREGVIGEEHIVADLGELMRGDVSLSPDAGAITVFKSLGLAMEDMVAAKLLLESVDVAAATSFEPAMSGVTGEDRQNHSTFL